VAWVAGGVGIVGAGICRGLLRAGATVLVNSRHETRLEQLADELGHPERLICVTGSMLPEHAATTIRSGLDRTNGQLNHVVAHCAVRWWARDHGDESSTLLRNADSLLAILPEDFPGLASQLASLHFAAAHHMMPRLMQQGGSYTWVTGGGPAQMRSAPGVRSSLGHVNAAVVYGLAGALRSELEGSRLRVSELRVREHGRASAADTCATAS
jgi:NAD(P)-dependent dehydrogenase (short-subunit alcohol dehydrogenase family)